jgi:hypothetical protein
MFLQFPGNRIETLWEYHRDIIYGIFVYANYVSKPGMTGMAVFVQDVGRSETKNITGMAANVKFAIKPGIKNMTGIIASVIDAIKPGALGMKNTTGNLNQY